jgi:hypothetical protein
MIVAAVRIVVDEGQTIAKCQSCIDQNIHTLKSYRDPEPERITAPKAAPPLSEVIRGHAATNKPLAPANGTEPRKCACGKPAKHLGRCLGPLKRKPWTDGTVVPANRPASISVEKQEAKPMCNSRKLCEELQALRQRKVDEIRTLEVAVESIDHVLALMNKDS